MRTYLKRLRHHPGVLPATAWTVLMILAGATGEHPIPGAAFGAGLSILVWLTVLLTAKNQPLPEEHRDD